jgi:peptidoglycan/xylan/chitin deacetylase (PgdA/CDA1 family)
MYFVRSPKLFELLYPELIWRMPDAEKKLYLTFDDGPDKTVTHLLLDILDQFKAKATFFCVGKKVEKFPELIKQIKDAGHSVGNHTYSHLKGKNVSTESFHEDISACNNLLHTRLFRPPYGSIKRNQIKQLKDQYKIYMWSVLPGDFDQKISKEKCLHRSIKYTSDGTIIVYHDNEKTKEKVLYTIPKYIEHFKKLGYTFEAL